MESIAGRVIAAAIGIAAVFALTFASNSVEHAIARDAAQGEQLSPEQVVEAYLAASATDAASAQAQYMDAAAVIHPAVESGCEQPGTLLLAPEVIVVHRQIAAGEAAGSVVDAFRISGGKIVEQWQSRASACEGGRS